MGMKSIRLESGTVSMIGSGAGSILCLEGSLWVTARGCRGDILLPKGERLDIRGLSRVCVQAFGTSTVACLDRVRNRPQNVLTWLSARIASKRSATSSFSY